MGSKCHLSNYHNIQLMADENEDARRLYNEFTEWYVRHEIANLERDRLRANPKFGKKSVAPREVVSLVLHWPSEDLTAQWGP
jgi:hypothetical protein